MKPWKYKFEYLVLDMLANKSYKCNKNGSYIIDPLIEFIEQEKSKSYQQGYRTRKYIKRKYEKDN